MNYQISLDISFKSNPFPGMYIALEGVDGCGKTTQRDALSDYFIKRGRTVTKTSEPRVDLIGGDLIMSVFTSEITMNGAAFQHLLTMNRLINHAEIVEPALQRGEIVISDRCMWSAVPYGLMDQGIKFNREATNRILLTQGILSPYHQSISPDIILYIDINADIALKRSLQKRGRREADIYEKKDKLQTIVRGYGWLNKEFPDVFTKINGEKSIDDITKEMIERVVISEKQKEKSKLTIKGKK